MKFLLPVVASLAVLGCVASPEPGSSPSAPTSTLTFRGDRGINVYDFENKRTHSGSHSGFAMVDCSDEQFFCFVGPAVLLAPRHCPQVDALLRQGLWQTADGGWARLLFRTASGEYFFHSNWSKFYNKDQARQPSGFVYRTMRGIVGIWFTDNPVDDLSDAAPPPVRYLEQGESALSCPAE